MVKINNYFKIEYLTCGRTRDNFLFENCPKEFIAAAKRLLEVPANGVKPCAMVITDKLENRFAKTLEQCKDDFEKSVLSRDLVCSICMYELLKGDERFNEKRDEVHKGIIALLSGDYVGAKKYHLNSPMPYEITKTARDMGKVELNIFLIDTTNKYIQQSINNFISSREPYSIKVFANQKLPSYRDQMGNLIQSPHDYMTIDVNGYITIHEVSTK